jgi:hypothetical protein
MDLMLALLIQNAVAPQRSVPAPAPRLPYQRSERIDLDALRSSLAAEARRERARSSTPAQETLWRGVPVRIIDGRMHGIW